MSGTKTGYFGFRQSRRAVSMQSPKAEIVICDGLDPDTGEMIFRCSSCGVNMAAKPKELSGLAVKMGNSYHIDRIANHRHEISSRVTWWVTFWWTVYLGCVSYFLLLGMNLVFK